MKGEHRSGAPSEAPKLSVALDNIAAGRAPLGAAPLGAPPAPPPPPGAAAAPPAAPADDVSAFMGVSSSAKPARAERTAAAPKSSRAKTHLKPDLKPAFGGAAGALGATNFYRKAVADAGQGPGAEGETIPEESAPVPAGSATPVMGTPVSAHDGPRSGSDATEAEPSVEPRAAAAGVDITLPMGLGADSASAKSKGASGGPLRVDITLPMGLEADSASAKSEEPSDVAARVNVTMRMSPGEDSAVPPSASAAGEAVAALVEDGAAQPAKDDVEAGDGEEASPWSRHAPDPADVPREALPSAVASGLLLPRAEAAPEAPPKRKLSLGLMVLIGFVGVLGAIALVMFANRSTDSSGPQTSASKIRATGRTDAPISSHDTATERTTTTDPPASTEARTTESAPVSADASTGASADSAVAAGSTEPTASSGATQPIPRASATPSLSKTTPPASAPPASAKSAPAASSSGIVPFFNPKGATTVPP